MTPKPYKRGLTAAEWEARFEENHGAAARAYYAQPADTRSRIGTSAQGIERIRKLGTTTYAGPFAKLTRTVQMLDRPNPGSAD